MNTFGVNNKHTVRVNNDAVCFKNFLNQTGFVALLNIYKFLHKSFVFGKFFNTFQ